MTYLSNSALNPENSRTPCDLRVRRNHRERGQFGRNDLERFAAGTDQGGPRGRGLARSPKRGLHDRGGLGRQLVERTVAVVADAEVDLSDHVGAEAGGDVDEQPDVDPVTVDEG